MKHDDIAFWLGQKSSFRLNSKTNVTLDIWIYLNIVCCSSIKLCVSLITFFQFKAQSLIPCSILVTDVNYTCSLPLFPVFPDTVHLESNAPFSVNSYFGSHSITDLKVQEALNRNNRLSHHVQTCVLKWILQSKLL